MDANTLRQFEERNLTSIIVLMYRKTQIGAVVKSIGCLDQGQLQVPWAPFDYELVFCGLLTLACGADSCCHAAGNNGGDDNNDVDGGVNTSHQACSYAQDEYSQHLSISFSLSSF